MPDLHSTVRHTDELRAAAEKLRDLSFEEIASSDDPLTVVRNLHAALDALRSAWPAISQAAHFDTPQAAEAASAFFTDDIKRGLQLAADGLWDASHSI